MPAYLRGELSLEAYLVRILAALCRANGGELRIKGELVDVITEPTTLLKDWDSHTQEVVIRTHMGHFGEVFRVVPEKAPRGELFACEAPPPPPLPPTPAESHKPSSVLDSVRLAEMENKLIKERVARMLREEMAARRRGESA